MAGPATVLGRIDRAAFVAALGERLRGRGLVADLARLESLTRALSVVQLNRRRDLYWAARIALVRHQRELAVFDQVFAEVFDAVFRRDPHARRPPLGEAAPPVEDAPAIPGRPGREPRTPDPGGDPLPWMTRPEVDASDENDGGGRTFAQLRASALDGESELPFDQFGAAQFAALGLWLESALADWPTRRARRQHRHPRGRRVDLRATLSASRATGFEPMTLVRTHPQRARRPLVLLCDVSRSMRPYTRAYVHLMRAAALTADAEVFAFSTDILRLTPALAAHGPAEPVIERAAQRLAGQSPGTRIGHSVRRYLASPQGSAARGAIVVIASDGWDADEPALLAAAMTRLRRRSRAVIWLNPRCAATGFAPLTGAMAAALPYCDRLLPGHTVAALRDVVDAIVSVR